MPNPHTPLNLRLFLTPFLIDLVLLLLLAKRWILNTS